METVGGLFGLATGYWISRLISFPQGSLTSKIPFTNKELPTIRIKHFQIFPRFRIHLKKKVIHVHHWIFLTAAFILLLTITASFTHLLFVKSLLFGGIIQGFSYPDRFQIVLKQKLP